MRIRGTQDIEVQHAFGHLVIDEQAVAANQTLIFFAP
jgi:hypothetical protein